MTGARTFGDSAGPSALLGDRYRLLRPIGSGGMAVVWEARDEVLGRTVAVKVLAGRHLGDPQSRELIRSEARAAAGLSHPNIAQIHDYGETATTSGIFPYVVMELIRGDTLQTRASQAPVTPRFAMRVCAEVGAALAAAHAEGLVHRDVKPANVMLAPTGAKVVDFGIAAAVAPGRTDDEFEVLGTAAYLAPERLLSDVVEPASDVYALAILLYQLLAGCLPWSTETTTQMLSAHIYVEPEPLRATAGVPGYVVELCNRCLAKDPTLRPSAREVAAVLAHGAQVRVATGDRATDEAVAGAALPPTDFAPAEPPAADDSAPAVRRPVPLRRWAVGAGVAAALLLAAWAFWPHDGRAVDGPGARAGAVWSQPSAPGAGAGVSPSATATAPVAGPAGVTPGVSVTRPRTTRTPGASATGPGRPARTTAPTTAPPATGDPAVHQLTSDGGSVTVTCPAPGTAQILSAERSKPMKVLSVDTSPGPAPTAVFRHGKVQITMTITCPGGEPSTVNTVTG